MDRKSRWMIGWITNIDGWMDKTIYEKNRSMSGWMDRKEIDEKIDGWMNRNDRWMVGCIEKNRWMGGRKEG